MKRTFKNTMFVVLTLMALIVSALGVTPAKAAPVQLAFYDPLGSQDPFNSTLAASAVDPSVTASVLSNVAGGYQSGTNTDRRPVLVSAGALNTATSFYISFTLTPVAPGMAIDLSTITYTYESYASGSSGTVSLMTSADGFTSVVDSKTFTGQSSGAWTFNASSVPATAGPLEIRLYAHDLVGGFSYGPPNPSMVDWVDLLSTAATGTYAPNIPGDGLRVYGEVVPACSANVTVTSNADSGAGSLRQALVDVCSGGTIDFAPGLSGATIRLASTLSIAKNMTIDGSALASQVILDGDSDNNTTGDIRIMHNPSYTVTVKGLAFNKGSSPSGSAINNGGVLNVESSTFTNNFTTDKGGALYNYTSGTMRVNGSTFIGNTSTWGGGAIQNDGFLALGGTLYVSNSTFYNNTDLNGFGGAIHNGRFVYGNVFAWIYNNTFSNNSNGVFVESGAVYLVNNIVANSTGGDLAGAFLSNTNNLTGTVALNPLALNGGPTLNMSLPSGSPALGAGNVATCAASPVNNLDQRGQPRPQGDVACDIGAYESALMLDGVPPTTYLDSTPPSLTNSTSATFTFHAEDNVSAPANIDSYCYVDSGAVWNWDPCTSPLNLSGLSEGLHTVWIYSVDEAGNSEWQPVLNAVYSWTVDLTAPDYNFWTSNPYEATGPGGANAGYGLSFYDDNGIASEGCTPASGSLFPIGTTTVNCTGTDNAGNVRNTTIPIQVVDTTAPTLNLPANITVPQTIPAGAVVNFTVTATDVVDASPSVSCTPASGSTFPVGTTTVNCSATDDYSNTSNGSFTVTVNAAAGGNLLKKPDFASATVFPSPWQAFGFKPPYAAALDCNIFNFSTCSVLFPAGNRSAMQRVVRSGVAGDTYSFGMYSAAQNAPAGGKYLVEVAFYNNYNRLVGISQLNFNLGTHGFELVSGPAMATGNYNKITFRFYYQNSSGRAWFDDAFLYFVGAP